MEPQEKRYAQWIDHRRKVAVPETFANSVMATIEGLDEARPPQREATDLPGWIYHSAARWVAATGVILIGLFRILYVGSNLLRTNIVMP